MSPVLVQVGLIVKVASRLVLTAVPSDVRRGFETAIPVVIYIIPYIIPKRDRLANVPKGQSPNQGHSPIRK